MHAGDVQVNMIKLFVLMALLLVGCEQIQVCENTTIIQNFTVEKQVYVDRVVEKTTTVTKTVYVNVTKNATSCTSLYDSFTQRLIRELKACENHIDTYINISNCTDYYEVKDRNFRLENEMTNCTRDFRQVNESLLHCNSRLEICLNDTGGC